MATVVNGKLFGVYSDGTLVAGAKTCKLTLAHDVRDTFTKDDAGWKTQAEGARSWSVSVDGLVAFDASNFAPDDMANLIVNRTKVALKFSSETTQHYWYHGYAYLKSYDIDASNEDSVSYSASFEGTGSLTQVQHT
jgi:predicted secreted protein